MFSKKKIGGLGKVEPRKRFFGPFEQFTLVPGFTWLLHFFKSLKKNNWNTWLTTSPFFYKWILKIQHHINIEVFKFMMFYLFFNLLLINWRPKPKCPLKVSKRKECIYHTSFIFIKILSNYILIVLKLKKRGDYLSYKISSIKQPLLNVLVEWDVAEIKSLKHINHSVLFIFKNGGWKEKNVLDLIFSWHAVKLQGLFFSSTSQREIFYTK